MLTGFFSAAVTVLALSLLGCGPREPDPGALLAPDGSALYADGVFTAAYSVTSDNGWQPYLQLTVRAGVITDACYGAVRAPRFSEESVTLLPHDERFLERYRLATGVRLTDLMQGLESELLARQELPETVPPLPPESGLTALEWVHWFGVLAEAALDAARTATTGTVRVANPGPYTAEDEPDELGWTGHLAVIFSDGGPASAAFEELRLAADGSVARKSDDAEYAERFTAATELTPELVASDLEAQLVAGSVDGVTGATGTSTRFRQLSQRIGRDRVALELPRRPCPR